MVHHWTITKWCKACTDNHEDIFTGKGKIFREKYSLDYPIFRFRVLDDDYTPYFYGLSTTDSSFAPLDQKGCAYGATMIEYYDNYTKSWELL